MGREEQIEEREVLDSIFPVEITGKPCRELDAELNNADLPLHQMSRKRPTGYR